MTALGDFLRSRRNLADAERVGLTSTDVRRVRGMRRQEVAALAAISVDYYTRLEQGRETNPSAQVLNALASALLLDHDARTYLFRLAGLSIPMAPMSTGEHIDPRISRLIGAWSDHPALIYDWAGDVRASNRLADVLFGGLASRENLLIMLFRNPQFYADWHTVTALAVAHWRMLNGAGPYTGRVRDVLTELLDTSVEFNQLWSRSDVRGWTLYDETLRHHEVGTLTLSRQIYSARFAPGLELGVYQAACDTRSAHALRKLAKLSSTTSHPKFCTATP